MLTTDDRLAIHELIGLYGLVIDEREWHRAVELFTDDVRYDMSELGLGVLQGKAAGWRIASRHARLRLPPQAPAAQA